MIGATEEILLLIILRETNILAMRRVKTSLVGKKSGLDRDEVYAPKLKRAEQSPLCNPRRLSKREQKTFL